MPPNTAKKAVLANQVALALGLLCVPYLPFFLGIGIPVLAWIEPPLIAFFAVIPWMNRRGWHMASRLSMITVCNLIVFGYSVYFGKETGFSLLFFAITCLSLILFDLSERAALIYGLTLGLFLHLMVAAISLRIGDRHILTEPVEHLVYVSMAFATQLILIYAVLFFYLANVESEKTLAHSRDALMDAHRQLQERQNMMVQNEKMASLGTLAAGMAHEINNPLGFLTGNLNVMKDYLGGIAATLDAAKSALEGDDAARDPDRRRAFLEAYEKWDIGFVREDMERLVAESLQGADRVGEIVRNLKWFARADESISGSTDINEGIESTLKIAWSLLKNKCRVSKDLGVLPLIPAHPGQLNQVYLSLLNNSVQATRETAEIHIATKVEDGFIVITFSDTGEGIPPENLSKVFAPFFTTKPVGKGTGLGLSVSYGIIKNHGGSIDVKSEVGKGATFTIRLPVAGPPAPT